MASDIQSVDCQAEDFQSQKKVDRMPLNLKTGVKAQLIKGKKN